jgi:hypothetical protein
MKISLDDDDAKSVGLSEPGFGHMLFDDEVIGITMARQPQPANLERGASGRRALACTKAILWRRAFPHFVQGVIARERAANLFVGARPNGFPFFPTR